MRRAPSPATVLRVRFVPCVEAHLLVSRKQPVVSGQVTRRSREPRTDHVQQMMRVLLDLRDRARVRGCATGWLRRPAESAHTRLPRSAEIPQSGSPRDAHAQQDGASFYECLPVRLGVRFYIWVNRASRDVLTFERSARRHSGTPLARSSRRCSGSTRNQLRPRRRGGTIRRRISMTRRIASSAFIAPAVLLLPQRPSPLLRPRSAGEPKRRRAVGRALARLAELTGDWEGSFEWTGGVRSRSMDARYSTTGYGSAVVETLTWTASR